MGFNSVAWISRNWYSRTRVRDTDRKSPRANIRIKGHSGYSFIGFLLKIGQSDETQPMVA